MEITSQIFYVAIALISLGLIFPAYVNFDPLEDFYSTNRCWLYMVIAQLISSVGFACYPFAGDFYLIIGEISQSAVDVFLLFFAISLRRKVEIFASLIFVLVMVFYVFSNSLNHAQKLIFQAVVFLFISCWQIYEFDKKLKLDGSIYLKFIIFSIAFQVLLTFLVVFHALDYFEYDLKIFFPSAGLEESAHDFIIRFSIVVLYILIVIGIGNYQFNNVSVFARKMILEREDQMLTILNELAMVRDNETGKHTIRTQEFVKVLAMNLYDNELYKNDLTLQFINNLYKATPLHDIGKVGIPDYILLKKGRHTPEESEIMKTHAAIGGNILKSSRGRQVNEVLEMAITIASTHHERWDGSGYPNALSGTNIPLAGRIVAIADVYDALTASRIYKKSWSHEDAKNEIIKYKGIYFDALLVEAFERVHLDFKKIANDFRDQV